MINYKSYEIEVFFVSRESRPLICKFLSFALSGTRPPIIFFLHIYFLVLSSCRALLSFVQTLVKLIPPRSSFIHVQVRNASCRYLFQILRKMAKVSPLRPSRALVFSSAHSKDVHLYTVDCKFDCLLLQVITDIFISDVNLNMKQNKP